MSEYTGFDNEVFVGMDKFRTIPALLLLSLFLVALDGHQTSTQAQQSREQCYECCAGSGLDEYYTEQCRLKCFRNPDHCIKTAAKEPAARPQAKPTTEKPQRTQPVEQPPALNQEQPVRPQPRRAEFVWPNPLNLVPGREFEAAGQILALNGIGPRHPNYPAAMRAVEQVLIDFGRNNPTGGALPTSLLERLVGQFR